MKFPIALQLYSVRDVAEKDFLGTLKAIKAMGFDGVEFAGLYGFTPDMVKAMLEEVGLTPVSAHVPYSSLVENPEKVVRDYADIGCKFIAIPYLTPEYRPGAEKFSEVIETITKVGEIAKKSGMILLYHNHDFEFQKISDEYALDILYRSVSSELLQTEIDTCWVNVAGENPSDYIRKYSGRSPVVHLKDFVMPGKKPQKMYELIDIADDQTAESVSAFELRPLGMGVQNFSEILKACQEVGSSWVVVEQDSPSMGKTSLECAQSSIDYLKNIE